MSEPECSVQMATCALKWMVVSQRPLKPQELSMAAELDTETVVDSTALEPELPLDINQLIDLCRGLLLWDKQLDVIRFSHLSVQEYLETQSMNQHWDIVDAHHLVMEACLWILQCPYPPESVFLYPYAARNWFHHCRSYQDLVVQAAASNKPSKHTLNVPSLRDFLPSFDEPTTSYKNWVHYFISFNVEEKKYLVKDELLRDLPVYPIFSAAFGGLDELVSWLWLAKGVDINVTNGRGAPLLQYAIMSGNVELVDRMITMGADVNVGDKTALIVAVLCNDLRISLLLLDQRVDINTVNYIHGTALGCATTEGNWELASLLLERGADINLGGGEYETALGGAICRGNMEFALLLLERGADINLIGGDYGTALGCAAWEGNMELALLLLERGADINLIGGKYGTALGCAAWGEEMGLALLLLERGADINLVGGKYGTSLGCAAWRGNRELALLLLERGADINLIGGDYGTALNCAAWKGNRELASLLLEQGADINLVGGKYGTALGCAASKGNMELALLLLERGADTNLVGGDYGTALGVSASFGRIEIVKLLTQHGAKPDLTNDDGMTPRGLAERSGHLDTIQFLDSWDGGLVQAEE